MIFSPLHRSKCIPFQSLCSSVGNEMFTILLQIRIQRVPRINQAKSKPTEMSLGVKYTFPLDVYPRYSYLQGWTLKLLDRFKAKIKKNHFEECVCQGYEELENIIAASQQLSSPEVTVFAQDKRLVPTLTKDLVQTMEPFKHVRLDYEKITWKDFAKKSKERNDFDSKILVVIANMGNNVSTAVTSSLKQDMKVKLDQLPEVQRRNTFIYDPDTKLHQLFTPDDKDSLPTKNVHPERISFDIQSVLERKVVTLLQKIEAYIEPLVPRESMDPGKSLLDDIKDTIRNLEICCLKEIFFNKPNQPKIYYIDTDVQGRDLIVKSSPEKKKRKKRKKRMKGKINNGQKGKSKDLKKKSPRQIWIDCFFFQSVKMAEGTELINLIERRTRCQMIEHLSKKYGIHLMVTTAFLTSDKFFCFEEKFGQWVKKEKINMLDSIEKVLDTCQAKITNLVLEVEQFIKEQYEELETMQRQQFELYGILRQTNYDVKIRELTRLDPRLQDELLSLREVTGCGTIYGILTLHASRELSESSMEKVKNLLRQYNYFKGFKVNVVSSKVEQMGNRNRMDIEIDNGTPLKAECLASDQSKYGTLGCFVDIKSKSNDQQTEKMMASPPSHQQQAQTSVSTECKDKEKTVESPDASASACQQQGNLGSNLHCVTCCHCVKDCKLEIKIKHGDQVFAEQTDYFIESGDRFDVALLKIRPEKYNSCFKKLWMRVEGGDKRRRWSILNDSTNLASRPVFKYGGISRYTCGVIASHDYKEQRIHETLEVKKNAEADHCLDPTINVIIVGSDSTKTDGNVQVSYMEQGSQTSQEVASFSTDGDSGSIICDTDIDNAKVVAISILHGALTRGKKWLCTYSALLRQTFDELEKRFNISIKVPDIEEEEELDNPFALVENDFIIDEESMETDIGPQIRDQATDQPEGMETDGPLDDDSGIPSKAEITSYKPSGLIEICNSGSRQQNLRQCRNLTYKKE